MTIEERLNLLEKRIDRVEKLVIRGDQECGYLFCIECHTQFEPEEAPLKHCGQELELYEKYKG